MEDTMVSAYLFYLAHLLLFLQAAHLLLETQIVLLQLPNLLNQLANVFQVSQTRSQGFAVTLVHLQRQCILDRGVTAEQSLLAAGSPAHSLQLRGPW